MPPILDFDLLNSPLKGANLIEASAGTGKTYTITGLFLRLVLEMDIPLSEILVVTYTEAATSELKERIRKSLREAIDVFSGRETGDPFLLRLFDKHKESPNTLRKLEFAINDFDRASIFTIHGFCLRALLDHAFASGIQFDAEPVTDEQLYRTEIIHDFWRRYFYTETQIFYEYACRRLNIESLHELAKKNAGNPRIKVVPRQTINDCREDEANYLGLFEKVRDEWERSRGSVEALITSNPKLDGRKYVKRYVPGWLKCMDEFLAGECLSCNHFKQFDKFCSSGLKGAVKGGQEPPRHEFFALCEQLKEARDLLIAVYDRKILGLKAEFIRYLQQEMEARKLRKNVLFFDDLLTKLDAALQGPNGENLSEILKGKFKAALIDEFQDTDAVQYSIFNQVFGAPPSILFLIGDPKQAIYGFRGADIFTYIEASSNASSRFTLSENWRSEPGLISAINALFKNSEKPFVFDEIAFLPAKPALAKNHERLSVEGDPGPLQIWYMNSSELSGKDPISKKKARKLIAGAVASEISRLIAAARIGDRPVSKGDIAVLVRKNEEGQLVQEALSRLGIHSVLFNVGNLFDSREAKEVQAILSAIANPSEEGLIRAALATDIMGVGGEEMDRLRSDDEGWDEQIVKFGKYHDIWGKHGFFRMFRLLLSREKVLPRLMPLLDGERRCTNILHLSEVLHKVGIEGNISPFGMVKWLSIQRDSGTPRQEEHQLRLESDENAVKIVTIHKSKGLEYPIVFCPFAWGESTLRETGEQQPFTFHDPASADRELTLDLGSPDLEIHKGWAEREQLAENLRLLYVALTRARHRCYLVWGRINEAATSAPAYLLHHRTVTGFGNNIDPLKTLFEQKDDASLWSDLEALRAGSDAIGVHDMPTGGATVELPAEPEGPELSECKFSGKIDGGWRTSSFSALTAGKPHHKAELPDRDEAITSDIAGEQGHEELPGGDRTPDMAAFPKGAASGILLHEIFQLLDFSSTDEAGIRRLVSTRLAEHGFDQLWEGPVREMVRGVLASRLDSAYGSFTLAEVSAGKRLNELEFYFPLRRTEGSKFREVLTRWVRGKMNGMDVPVDPGRIWFETIEGFMRGFIDLVFEVNNRYYILDWKSGFLGPTVEHYNREALETAIRENLYHLQYYLYTVALHQYLKVRIPRYSYETHFGEVYYMFLRGIDPSAGPQFGIYRDRPSWSSIEALLLSLIPREGE